MKFHRIGVRRRDLAWHEQRVFGGTGRIVGQVDPHLVCDVRPGRTADGRINRSTRKVSMTIYVSSTGRIFLKKVNRTGRFGRDFAAAPTRTARGFHFAGSTLVGVLRDRSGNMAAQWKVSFDSSFQSCSAEVIVGGAGGAPINWIALNGDRYTATGRPTISDMTCSVENGNAFAK